MHVLQQPVYMKQSISNALIQRELQLSLESMLKGEVIDYGSQLGSLVSMALSQDKCMNVHAVTTEEILIVKYVQKQDHVYLDFVLKRCLPWHDIVRVLHSRLERKKACFYKFSTSCSLI